MTRSLVIALDARTIFSAIRRGTGKNLVDLYSVLAAQNPTWRFKLFHQRDFPSPFLGIANISAHRIDIPGDRFDMWQQVRLPVAAALCGADLLHCPANIAPKWSVVPIILTIHDLIPIEESPEKAESKAWFQHVSRSARRARGILTPSFYTKQRLVEAVGLAEARIVVNPWAPDRNCHKVTAPDELNTVRERYGLPRDRDYILALGAIDPRKNVERIIYAWAQVDQDTRKRCSLLIVGMQPEGIGRFRQMVTDLVGDDSCLVLGFAQEKDMGALISGALCLCYPSRNEGFGLPILDAFACGTPVITSNRSSLPEVAEDAALLVDPDDPHAIAKALGDVISSTEVQQTLTRAGYARLQSFSWAKTAQTVTKAFESAAGI